MTIRKIRGIEIDIEFKNGIYSATNNKRRVIDYKKGKWIYGKPETITQKELLIDCDESLKIFGRKGKIHLEFAEWEEDKTLVCDTIVYSAIHCRVEKR